MMKLMLIEPILASPLPLVGGIIALVLLVFGLIAWVASRYKRCPPDRVLVVYGRTGAGKTGAELELLPRRRRLRLARHPGLASSST